jgi:ketosteroid isomerase-like protein
VLDFLGEVVEGRTTITLPDTTRYPAAARAIVRLERRRSAAISAHDTAWLATLYAPDFQGVAASGRRIDRAALFRIFALDDTSAHFLIDELEVRELAPNTATVTGRLRMVTGGGAANAGSRYLHVYVRRGGRWQILAAEGTAVAATPPSGPAPVARSGGDSAAIRARLDAWVAAQNRRDRGAASTIWAPGVVGWFPRAELFSDSAARAVAGVPAGAGDAHSTYQLTVESLVVSGDVAVVHDVWRETRWFRTESAAASRVIRGSELWRRQPGGTWKIARWVSAPEPWTKAPAG